MNTKIKSLPMFKTGDTVLVYDHERGLNGIEGKVKFVFLDDSLNVDLGEDYFMDGPVFTFYAGQVELKNRNSKEVFTNNYANAVLRELIHIVALLEPLENNLNVPGLATLNGARKAIREAHNSIK